MLVLAPGTFRVELTEAEKNVYRFPYATPDDRLALADALSLFFDPAQIKIMQAYITWLQETELPMLYTYTMPGILNPNGSTAEWAEAIMKNIKTINMGEGFHYVMEDQTEALAAVLIAWYERLS